MAEGLTEFTDLVRMRSITHTAHLLNAPCCGLLFASPDRYLRLTLITGRSKVRLGLVGEGLANNRASVNSTLAFCCLLAPIEW